MAKNKIFIIGISLMLTVATNCLARDLAGIEWEEFKNKSELILSGYLIKAELLHGPKQEIYYTYRVPRVFKGEKLTEVSFKAPLEENINKTIGRHAIIALKKVGNEWKLSIDERSCWTHQNEMKEDFHSYPIYKIPTVLLYDFPKELGEKVKLKKHYGDDYRTEETFVYPMYKVDKYLEKYLK